MSLRRIGGFALLATLVLAQPLWAQNSKEYAGMARSTWAAFECASLASKLKNSTEQERLFTYGYKTGLSFISALQTGKIEQKDLSGEAPWLMLLLLQGPTPDFMLGRVYEAAQDEALKNVLHTAEKLNPEDIQRLIAQSEFTKRNCQLIDKAR